MSRRGGSSERQQPVCRKAKFCAVVSDLVLLDYSLTWVPLFDSSCNPLSRFVILIWRFLCVFSFFTAFLRLFLSLFDSDSLCLLCCCDLNVSFVTVLRSVCISTFSLYFSNLKNVDSSSRQFFKRVFYYSFFHFSCVFLFISIFQRFLIVVSTFFKLFKNRWLVFLRYLRFFPPFGQFFSTFWTVFFPPFGQFFSTFWTVIIQFPLIFQYFLK